MSYDLMVFEPAAAPSSTPEFRAWYEQQTAFTETHDYTDPAITTPELRQWYEAMIADFPPLNGPDQTDDVDNPRASDYSIGASFIYVGFAWSQAEAAYKAALAAAEAAGVGIFDTNGDGAQIWLPRRKSSPVRPNFWRRLLGLP